MNTNSPTGPGNKGKGKALGSPTGQSRPQKRKSSAELEDDEERKKKSKTSHGSNGSNAAESSKTAGTTPAHATEATTAAGSSSAAGTAPAAGAATAASGAPPAAPPAATAPQSNRARIRRRHAFSNTFRVLAGDPPNHLVFTLHEDLFTRRSRYFHGARDFTKKLPQQAGRREDFTHVVELRQFDADVFGHYVSAAMTGKFDFDEPKVDVQLDWRAYFDLYILADYLADFAMANKLIDTLINAQKISKDLLDYKTDIDYLHAHSHPNSKLRALCQDWLLHETVAEDNDRRGDINHELLLEVFHKYRVIKDRAMAGFQERGQEHRVNVVFNRQAFNAPVCQYHLHDRKFPRCQGRRDLIAARVAKREMDPNERGEDDLRGLVGDESEDDY